MASGPIISWQVDEETMETATDSFFFRLYYFCALKSLQMVTAAMKLKADCSLEENL